VSAVLPETGVNNRTIAVMQSFSFVVNIVFVQYS